MANDIKYIAEYQKANTTQVNIRLSKKYDIDIIKWLENKDPKATYIKQLIREDMKRSQERFVATGEGTKIIFDNKNGGE